ncbi:hypothetical protein HG535_0C02790 [Zygotorulaspora mrakii]|uniref:tRNA-5-taurinomethyluridine 2-sulfurtransferase n=1 Tax=Zygotorulaspora mrakii TaxID=42260 RepID=A0A7H9B0D3_ZYGMR|nr:uncharacterized protein HG535_0C02790 [Zygotorulaspora mrakii]QLG71927.1 hypothetical protein HG535_0C02790 [Zygotorulaspora mrakii]
MLSNLAKLAVKRNPIGYKPQVWPGKFDNIVIAMSSGVDSSVSAALFAGYPNAKGIYMQNWTKEQSLTDPSDEPCYERDWKDVVRVAEHLNLPVERVNFEKDYWIDVFEPMLLQYDQGLTPNPDIGCNRFVKFGKLREVLDQKYGSNNYWLVTGHYARVLADVRAGSHQHLLRSFYTKKDQSYYLSQINFDILGQLLLPMGHLTKPEVRRVADSMQLPTANKPDSQGICFVNNSQHGKFNKFLQHYLPDSTGNIVTVDESSGIKRVWGSHQGLWSYTIGQKIGLSMPQGDPRYSGAWYVAEKLRDTNELVIVRGKDHDSLLKNQVTIQNFKILGCSPEEFYDLLNSTSVRGHITMQYRSLQDPITVHSYEFTHKDKGELALKLKLESKQRAMAPGQYCCLYMGARVLGSGPITETL